MNAAVGRDISGHLFKLLGYDSGNNKVTLGALAELTHPQIRDDLREMLIKECDFSEVEAEKVNLRK